MPTMSRRQSAAHRLRDRRRARQDPMLGLMLTHDLGVVDTSVDTDVVFPDRDVPITFGATVEIAGVAAIGIVFEFGSSTNGLKLAIGSGKVYLAAGNGTAATATGIDGEAALAALAVVGARVRLVVAVKPTSGQARVWANGQLVLRLDEASATPMLNGIWADTNAGAVGAAHAGASSTQRLPETVNSAPADFAVVEPLRAAVGQVPRQFD